jgi:protein-S-isoprenylcysteine O-methyltransferase Ste14
MTHASPDAAPADDPGPGVRIQPPLIYAASMLAGIGLNKLWPLAMPFGLHGPLYSGVLLAIVLLLSGFCIREYQKAGTEVRADRPDTALITTGPYRYTRNPLYLCLTLVQPGVAMYLNNAWILGLTVASVLAISGYAIRREERYLEQLFGQDYRDYRQRVRRWL